MDILALGTTHADYFYGSIPCKRELIEEEVKDVYELNTERVIVECINECGIDALAVPRVVVKNHDPFSRGKDASAFTYHAVVMEVITEMDLKTLLLNS